MLAEPEIDELEGLIVIRPFRNLFCVGFKSTRIQRWAAAARPGGNYNELTISTWNASAKYSPGQPEGSQFVQGHRHILYFEDAEKARKTAVEFVRNLKARGIKL